MTIQGQPDRMSGMAMTSQTPGGEAPAERVVTRNLSLTDSEMVLLDGACRPDVQAEVDAAKTRLAAASRYADLSPALAGFIADVLAAAKAEGRLRFAGRRLRHCKFCGDSPQPAYVPYKGGPNRGLPNYKKPRYLAGIDLAPGSVSVDGFVRLGGCGSCIETVKPYLVEALATVRAELPDQLTAEGAVRFRRHDRRRCTRCGWEGHEGEMGRLRTLMGDGTYPGICPGCGAEQPPLSFERVFESAEGFAVVEVAPPPAPPPPPELPI